LKADDISAVLRRCLAKPIGNWQLRAGVLPV
jgi:hypothetical protein